MSPDTLSIKQSVHLATAILLELIADSWLLMCAELAKQYTCSYTCSNAFVDSLCVKALLEK